MNLSIPKPKKGALKKPPTTHDPKITNLKKRSSKAWVAMSLRVTAEFRRELKLYATGKDLSMSEVLKNAFEEYKLKHI